MRFKILCIFLSVTNSLCESNMKYCVTNGDLGLIISDKTMGKDGNSGLRYKYLKNVTLINLTSSEWQLVLSNGTLHSSLHEPIVDERWEMFRYNDDTGFQDLWGNTTNKTLFFSVKMYSNSTYLSKNLIVLQWYHLKLQNDTMYICNTNDSNMSCEEKVDTQNRSDFDFYTNSTSDGKALWKVHEYNYIFNIKINTATDVYKGNSTNCSDVQHGWIKLHIAMCKVCKMFLKLQANDGTNRTETFNITGTGHWHTKTHNITDFTSCFNLSVITKFDGGNESEPFWAIGDKLYFSKNDACANNTRYSSFNSSNISNLICEDTNNTHHKITSKLPTPQCPITPKEEGPSQISFFSFLYLLIIIPIVSFIGGISLCWFKRTSKVKCENKSTNDENIKLFENSVHVYSPLNSNKNSWPPLKTSEFDDYITHIFDITHHYYYTSILKQYSDLPSGFLKPAQEAKKEENTVKNRFDNIYPYDENRVTLNKTIAGKYFQGDYINASYIQGPTSYKEYIIAQNPQTNTVNDFWIMIWQEGITHCIMITSEHEEYIRYWPNWSEKCTTYAGLEISLVEIEEYEFFRKHKLLVNKQGKTREISLVHYYSWQDDDLNLSKSQIVPFIKYIDKCVPHCTPPVLFQCLDGTGRSGTVVLCDIILKSLAITDRIDMYFMATKLIRSRIKAISNLEQYILAHLIIKDCLNIKK